MDNYYISPNSYRCIGVIRVKREHWFEHEDAIRSCLSDGRIINVLRVSDDDGHSGSVDIFLEHPEFELTDTSRVPRYEVEFVFKSAGMVDRGPFIKLPE